MERESISKRMEHITTEIGKMISTRDKVKSYGLTAPSLKGSIAMARNMVEGAFTGLMEAHLTVTLSIIKCLAMVSISGQIQGSTTVSGLTICSMVKDTSNGKMGENIVENTSKINARVTECFLGPMAVSIQECGTKVVNTEKAYTEMLKERLRKEYGIRGSAKVIGLLTLPERAAKEL